MNKAQVLRYAASLVEHEAENVDEAVEALISAAKHEEEQAKKGMKVSTTKRLRVVGANLNVGTLRTFLGDQDADAVVSIRITAADRPGELQSTVIEATSE